MSSLLGVRPSRTPATCATQATPRAATRSPADMYGCVRATLKRWTARGSWGKMRT
jgi:hypothetical protein